MARNAEIFNGACQDMRIILAENKSGNIFKGIIGSYGVIRNADCSLIDWRKHAYEKNVFI